MGLFLWELVFEGAYYRGEFCVSKWVGLDNKNSSQHGDNSLKQLKAGTLTVHGLIVGRAYYRKDINCFRALVGEWFWRGLSLEFYGN